MPDTAMFRHEQVLIDGVSLHLVEAGKASGRPVVLLHGWPQSWVEWRNVMALAAGEFHLVAIDLPGIGDSSTLAVAGSKRRLAALVHHLLDRLHLVGAILVGHDIGGMIAYAYLRRYTDIAGVVIVDVVIPGLDPWEEIVRNPHIWHFAFQAIPELPELLVQGHQAEYFDYFFDTLADRPSRITRDARARYASAYQSDTALKAGFDFYRAFPSDARDNLKEARGETRTPVLYLRGSASQGDIGTYASGLRRAGVANLTSQLIAESGHFIPDEQPVTLWTVIHEFIDARSREAVDT